MKDSNVPTRSACNRTVLLGVSIVLLILILPQFSWGQSNTGDHLWNFRENADDRFHDNTPWLRPWRYNYDDGCGRWVGEWSYEVPWGPASTIGNPDGSFTISRSRDHQFHAWTYVYCETARIISFSGSGDCVPRAFLNYAFDVPIGFPASLNLSIGWHRIDITGYNQNDSYTFSCGALANLVDIMNSTEAQPPNADADGPYPGSEGSPITFDASASSDPDGDPLEYRWDFDTDGTWDTGWSSSPTASHTWFDDWTGTATVEVSDGQFSDSASAPVTVLNVAPEADAGADQDVDEGETVNFSSGFEDPGTQDDHVIDWDFGDGGTASGTLTPAHVYGDNGMFTVVLTVSDDDTGVGSDATTVTVSNAQPQVVIESVGQPNPHIILPHHRLTFTGSFTDPGWLDTHTFTWDFDDGATDQGVPDEENDPPDATGTSVVRHAYSEPGDYSVTLTITDDDGGAGTSDPWVVRVRGPRQAVEELNNYIQDLPDGVFEGPAGNRRNALHNKLEAVIELIADGQYEEAIDKLQHDVRAKADGSVDGNPKDDWITDPAARQQICAMINDIIAYLESL